MKYWKSIVIISVQFMCYFPFVIIHNNQIRTERGSTHTKVKTHLCNEYVWFSIFLVCQWTFYPLHRATAHIQFTLLKRNHAEIATKTKTILAISWESVFTFLSSVFINLSINTSLKWADLFVQQWKTWFWFISALVRRM